MVKESGEVVSIGLLKLDESSSRWSRALGKLGGEWGRLVGNKVLESSSGNVMVEESGEVVSITLLGKLGG
jgi:hypothetical protein